MGKLEKELEELMQVVSSGEDLESLKLSGIMNGKLNI